MRENSTSAPAAASDGSHAATGGQETPPIESIIHIPVGSFDAGSHPGEPGRDPRFEAHLQGTRLGPFRIDALPYSAGPNEAPQLAATPDEAQVLCAQKGGRLCTELEWEHACKGPTSTLYPTGTEPCSSKSCTSSFNVRDMTLQLEWTASTFGQASKASTQQVLRGAPESAAPAERRCATRRAQGKDKIGAAFRCCYGAPNAARVTEPTLGEPYREVEVSKKELAKWLLADAHTKDLAENLALFSESAVGIVFERGPGESKGFTLTTNAVEWQPARGMKLLVVAGRSGKRTAFVVAYHQPVEPNGPRKLAGSFVMKNEKGPIVLAYAPSIRPRMHFSGCWGCPGETGKLLFRPPEGIVLLQP